MVSTAPAVLTAESSRNKNQAVPVQDSSAVQDQLWDFGLVGP